MLDVETRRRIDTARDILVGKVPDPKSQVEQITIALIYKFMWDIEAQSEEVGGKGSYFVGEFARYAWPKLMRSGLGGFETLNLYAEALTRIPENPGIPPLFRNIFDNAYLPYRDPETLREFLKVIDQFEYDHSERLGDAFEYLLSIMGAQGDAGQFRTPRHIIDFMVDVVDPRLCETVLDPACGTAGFLISAYKHVQRANTDSDGQSTLTPYERGRLAESFTGYDISPDMVCLSLVNMYLHGFVKPDIHEYDTLTSEERWDERADVILANPPFMSPRGGIRPHNRFSVQARRSEVLFVDYMAEHLTPTGRAGIIVPEGVIFQSQRAHTQLRKMLVEDYLVAVVSLPAGVFKPYSGVKTSILILDRDLARRSDRIAFFKVENDGFDLGAQRRPIDQNDLPQVRAKLTEHLRRVCAGESLGDFQPALGLVVGKERIAAGGDFHLSSERYRAVKLSSGSYPYIRIGDLSTLNPRKSELSELDPRTVISFLPMADLNECQMRVKPHEERILSDVSASYTYFAENDVLLARVTPCFENGKAGIATGLTCGVGAGSSEYHVIRCSDQILPEWMYFCVTHQTFRAAAVRNMTGTGGLQRLPRRFLESFPIPTPPLDVQQKIVAEIEGFQKVIDGTRAVIDNYHPHIPINPGWPHVQLGEICEIKSGGTPHRSEKSYWNDDIPWVGSAVCKDTEITRAEEFITESGLRNSAAKMLRRDSTLIALVGATIGKTGLLKLESTTNQNVAGLFPKSLSILDPVYLFHAARHLAPEFSRLGERQFRMANLSFARKQLVPVPPLCVQRDIVAEIESERALVNANCELIRLFERKVAAVINRVWSS